MNFIKIDEIGTNKHSGGKSEINVNFIVRIKKLTKDTIVNIQYVDGVEPVTISSGNLILITLCTGISYIIKDTVENFKKRIHDVRFENRLEACLEK